MKRLEIRTRSIVIIGLLVLGLGIAALRLTEVPEVVVLVGGFPLYMFLLRYQSRRETRTDQATRYKTEWR